MPRPTRNWIAPQGHPPLTGGPAWQALGVLMAAARAAEGDRATADGTRFRGSMALDCERKIALQALGVAPAVELGTEQLVTFDIGQSYHDRIQQALVDTFGAQTEVKCSYRDEGGDVSGHADAVYEHAGQKVIVEIKSMKAYAFGLAIDGNQWDNYGPGPKQEHLTQAALYGLAPQIQADLVHMIYINKDSGEMAEWLLPMHGALVHLGGPPVTPAQLARRELVRFARIGESLDAGMMPARVIPGHGLVSVPPAADTKVKPWNCRYCGWQPICAAQPAEAFPVAELVAKPW